MSVSDPWEIQQRLERELRGQAGTAFSFTEPTSRRGWRQFHCLECSHNWREAARDAWSPSGEDCPKCGKLCVPLKGERDGSIPCDAMGNIPSATIPHVVEFAQRMEGKLAKNRHKGDRDGWLKDNPPDLFRRLVEETEELRAAMIDADIALRHAPDEFAQFAKRVANEAADVGNFAMMLADWHLSRIPKQQT